MAPRRRDASGDDPGDIKRVQDKFVAAAVRCKKAGYDGVELHGAHSYLIAQFFSKYYNHRTDAYGGSLENRCRFIDEIIAAIRAKLGPLSHFGAHLRRRDDPGARLPHPGGRAGDRPAPGSSGHRLHQYLQRQLLERQRQLRALFLHSGLEKTRGPRLSRRPCPSLSSQPTPSRTRTLPSRCWKRACATL